MKTIIKLLIAAAILNAGARGGLVAFNHYRLKDAAQELLTFGTRETPEELRTQILVKAAEFDVPLREEGVTVQREGVRTSAEAEYTRRVELFPNYPYTVNLSFDVEAYSLTGLK